jgi:ketosteroid isomerase-like protein
MATRKAGKADKRTTARKAPAAKSRAAKKTTRKTPAKRKPARAAARPKTPTAEALARKIIRVTQDPSRFVLEDLYAEDCTSWGPRQAEPALGHEGLRAKREGWEEAQDSSKAVWTPLNLFSKKNSICIEWEMDLVMRDGRSVKMTEIAIHHIKGGKIASERFYYDPAQLEPPPQAAPEPVVVAPPPPEPDADAILGDINDPTRPKVDPIDL